MHVGSRRLLQAAASGVALYATPASGLDPADYRPLAEFGGSRGIAGAGQKEGEA